jgi:hypothetical protein
MRQNKQQTQDLLFRNYYSDSIRGAVDSPRIMSWADLNGVDLADYVYEPDDTLISRIADYQTWCQTESGEDAGQLMEEIAYLAFRCLKGRGELNSYQSYDAQHDLVVDGNQELWNQLMDYLHLPRTGRTILVEAKNKKNKKSNKLRAGNQEVETKVSAKEFSRLCAVIQNKFTTTCHLGIFFTRFGASGFPHEDRSITLSFAWATQVIFHAITEKFVVVLTHKDILSLVNKGALPRILEEKIREVEAAKARGMTFENNYEGQKRPILPPHLAKYEEK